MKQSEIWFIDLEPSKGAEIRKTRPAIIINDNRMGKLPLKIIVPITEWKDHYENAPWMVKILHEETTGLSKLSAADCFQIRSISEERLVEKIGFINHQLLLEIKIAIDIVLGI